MQAIGVPHFIVLADAKWYFFEIIFLSFACVFNFLLLSAQHILVDNFQNYPKGPTFSKVGNGGEKRTGEERKSE